MRGVVFLTVGLSLAGMGVQAMPKPVLWLRADKTNEVTFGEIAPAVTTNAFAGLPAFAFADGAYVTARAVLTNRTVIMVARPDLKQQYNPGVFGRRGSIARSVRGWGKWGEENWDAGKESFFFGGKAYVDGVCGYDPSNGVGRAHVSFGKGAAHILAAVAREGVVYAPTVGANRDIKTDRAFWSGSVAELMVFDYALDEEQIVQVSDRLLDKWRIYPQVENLVFPVYFRGQKNAALRSVIHARLPATFEVKASVAGQVLEVVRVTATKGENRFAVPFSADLAEGRHPYAIRIVRLSDGRVVHDEQGEIEMRPPLKTDGWKFFDWGGNKQPPIDFLRLVGITVANAYVHDDDADRNRRLKNPAGHVRKLIDEGFLVNLRYENAGLWRRLGFDAEAIAADTRRHLEPYEGLAPWVMTLVNTETYSMKVFGSATNAPCFREAAQQALGGKADFRFQGHPLQLPFEDKAAVKAGLKGLRGVVKHDNAALETLGWFADKGHPAYRVTAATARAVKAANPDGLVWTEPLAGSAQGAEVDMLADWIYAYGAKNRLAEQYRQYGKVRGLGRKVKYMPTISPTLFYSGLNVTGTGELEPSKANKDHPTASAEELMLYTWIALGATRHDALSIWNLGDWHYGKHDEDAPARYGEFIRTKFRPVAEKLKGLENERPPVAVLAPSMPSAAAGGARFSAWHCHRQQMLMLGQGMGIPFDYLFDAEITAEKLRRYRVVYLPWAYCLYEEQVEALAQASAAGTKVVTDAPGAWLAKHCRNFECLKDVSYRHPKDLKSVLPLEAWARRTGAELRGEFFAWSDRDGDAEGSFTFVKEDGAKRYVLVINGAPTNLTITTHVKGGKTLTHDYAPSEARLFEP